MLIEFRCISLGHLPDTSENPFDCGNCEFVASRQTAMKHHISLAHVNKQEMVQTRRKGPLIKKDAYSWGSDASSSTH